MRALNTDLGLDLATDLRPAYGFWPRFRGLMLSGKLHPGEGLHIRPCSSIHMMFMLFAIDAVFLDREGTVTKVARNVRPWIGFSMGGKGGHSVLELPVGAAGATAVGHRIDISDA